MIAFSILKLVLMIAFSILKIAIFYLVYWNNKKKEKIAPYLINFFECYYSVTVLSEKKTE